MGSQKLTSAFTGPKSFLCSAVNHTIYRVGVSDKPASAAPTQMTPPPILSRNHWSDLVVPYFFIKSAYPKTPIHKCWCFLPEVNMLANLCYLSAPLTLNSYLLIILDLFYNFCLILWSFSMLCTYSGTVGPRQMIRISMLLHINLLLNFKSYMIW